MKFVKQLEKALPDWVERGWVSAEGAERLMAHERDRAGGGIPYLTVALSMLGVLLLGAGVISFFAANWDWLPKVAKLAILFGAMWGAYAAAGWLLGKGGHPLVGQAVLLLGVILFGANIWLIAQIYHISAHYPNGVLMWALGALLAAWLLHSQAAATAAVLLGILWTGMEGFGFDRHVHWPYLVLWLACLPPIVTHRWRVAAHASLAGLLFWSWSSLFQIEWNARGALLYLLQLYFLSYLCAFLAGMLAERTQAGQAFSGILKRYAGLAALVALLCLTFPELHRGAGWWGGGVTAPANLRAWTIGTLVALGLAVALAWLHRRGRPAGAAVAYLDWGWALLAGFALLILANLFAGGEHPHAVAIGFNLLYFGGLVWLIYAAIAARDRGLVNIAFAFFALGILARYLDTFWSLLGRSYFFMAGGVVLIAAGILLERSRRRITRTLASPAR